MISDQEILEQYKLSIEQEIKELLQKKNIRDIFEIEAFTKKYKENFVVGFRKGKAEEKIEIAKNLLSQNIDINTISIATGLSIAEIRQLKS
jgi:predicted transposase/invertase (TIGR01784 family)